MRFFQRRNCLLLCAAILCLTPFGCEDSVDNNATRKSLDTLLADLDIAVSKNSVEELNKVVRSAQSLQATSQSHIQSKNLILATANEKLARIEFRALSASLYAVKATLQNVASQSTKIVRIRSAADSFYVAGQPTNTVDMGQKIELGAMQAKEGYAQTLALTTSTLATSNEAIEAARAQATQLSETAQDLFEEAQEQGLVQGHPSYKKGVKAVRRSQRYDKSAESIEVESTVLMQRSLEDARAELEAIASILNGVQNTSAMLDQIRTASMQNAATLREFADGLDNEVARVLDTTIETTDILMQKLDSITNEIQAAIQAVSRSGGNNRNAQEATAAWKLGLQWLLGQVEESKHALLDEENAAITTIISNNIVTSANKWKAIADTLEIETQRAADNAITAYENAKGLSSSLGPKSDMLSMQLDSRISVLQGNPIQVPAPNNPETPANEDSGTSSVSTSGFATPQELIVAFNAMPPFERADGNAPAPDLSLYYESADANGQKFISMLQKIAASSANLAIAVRTHIGEEAVEEMLAKLPPSPAGGLMSNLNIDSLEMQDADNATATDLSGKSKRLQVTSSGWKILMGSNPNADPELQELALMMLESFAQVSDLIDTLTNQINAGNITSIEQLEQAMESATGSMSF